MPATFGRDGAAPDFLELSAQLGVFHMLETRQAIGNGAHVAAALDVILSAQRIDAAAIAANVAGEQREVDEGYYVVDRVVMLGDSESPAELGARGLGVNVRGLPNYAGGDAGIALGALQRVFFHASPVGFKAAGGILNKLCVGKSGGDNFAAHGVGQRNIGTNIQAQPNIGPLRGAGAAWVDYEKLGALAHTFQNMMKENRMGFAGVGAPQKDNVGLLRFAVGTGAAARSENRRQTGDARSVSSAVATVNIIASDDRADEFLCGVVQLVGGLGATKHAKGLRTVLGDFAADAFGDAIERLFPACGAMGSVFAE